MAEREPTRKQAPSRVAPTASEDFPIASPSSLPSGDYSYTLEICMNLRESMGKVVEAIETLKKDSEKQAQRFEKLDEKLSTISRDIFAAKAIGGVLILLAGIAGYFGNMIFNYVMKKP